MRFFVDQLLRPLIGRLGSMAGVSLASFGMAASDAALVESAVLVIGGFLSVFFTQLSLPAGWRGGVLVGAVAF